MCEVIDIQIRIHFQFNTTSFLVTLQLKNIKRT